MRFHLQRPLDEAMLAKLAGTHTVYGIQRVSQPSGDTVVVEYDATRLRPAEVEAALASAGIPAVGV